MKLSGWVSVPPEIYEAGFPLELCILGCRNPLKVFETVVSFIAVYMVNVEAIFISGNKSPCDQAMKQKFMALPFNHHGNCEVSVFPDPGRQKKFRLLPLMFRAPPALLHISMCVPFDASLAGHSHDARRHLVKPIDVYPGF